MVKTINRGSDKMWRQMNMFHVTLEALECFAEIGMGLMPILTGITKAVPIGLGLPLIPRLPFVGRVCAIFVVVSGVCRRNNTAYYTLTDLSGSG